MYAVEVRSAQAGELFAGMNSRRQPGRTPASGAKTAGRWHTPGSTLGWHLIEASDLALVAEHVAEWADVLEIDVYPVIEDTESDQRSGIVPSSRPTRRTSGQ